MSSVARRLKAFVLFPSATAAALLLAAGTAAARDAHVRSFDATKILVHFFPAAGLKGPPPCADGADGTGLGSARLHRPELQDLDQQRPA